MGVRNWVRNHRMSDPVTGTYRLNWCSDEPGSGPADIYNYTDNPAGGTAAYSNCRMAGVVTGPGIAPTQVTHKCLAPTSKWPRAGQELPVQVDRADPTRLVIRWHRGLR